MAGCVEELNVVMAYGQLLTVGLSCQPAAIFQTSGLFQPRAALRAVREPPQP